MLDDPDKAQAGLEDEAAFEGSLISESIIDLQPVEGGESSLAPSEAPPETPPAETGRQPAWAGRMLGHFKLLRRLGSGAMGMVVQAMDVNLQRIVALKILRKRIRGADQQKRVEQFLREARAAAQIEHPNVVRIHEINQHGGWWYIAMEMLEGETLSRVVRATGPLPPERACPLLADAATALSVAHELGIVHRDVKPANLIIGRNGRCKLTDFGLVRLNDPNDPFDFTNKSVGTPQFIAPEMILRREPTPALDVYSLGATLYYALVGRPPYTGKKIDDIIDQHLKAPPPDLLRELPECPASLARLVQRAMAKDPAERPTAADFAAALTAEAIAWRAEETEALGSGSGVVGPASGQGEAPTGRAKVTADAPTVILPAPRPGRPALSFRSVWALIGLACPVIVALWALTVFLGGPRHPGEPAAPDAAGLAQRFAGAPETYGVLPPGAIPKPAGAAAEPPPFSWVGKVNTTDLRFAASRRGRHFYPIDDPRAALIRLEDFVGYKTAAQAVSDGKDPARPAAPGQ